jgi:tight adherence protein C
VLIAALFLGVGLGLATYGVLRTREVVASAGAAPFVPVVERVGSNVEPRPSLIYRAIEPLLALGGRAGAVVSPKGRMRLLEHRIVLAGQEGTITIERVLAYKGIAAIVGALFGLLLPTALPAVVGAAGVGALASFVPDVVLDGRARRRQDEIARGLPDALDLLALTVEAGLGLEQALAIVAEHLHGPLADELTRVLREVELGVSRRDALSALRERTSVPELSGFVVAIIQADEMGASIADVLRVQAAHVRMKRRQRARERAAKTPVKILVPLVLGIFPAIFVVTVGPGMLTIAKTLLK